MRRDAAAACLRTLGAVVQERRQQQLGVLVYPSARSAASRRGRGAGRRGASSRRGPAGAAPARWHGQIVCARSTLTRPKTWRDACRTLVPTTSRPRSDAQQEVADAVDERARGTSRRRPKMMMMKPKKSMGMMLAYWISSSVIRRAKLCGHDALEHAPAIERRDGIRLKMKSRMLSDSSRSLPRSVQGPAADSRGRTATNRRCGAPGGWGWPRAPPR